MEESKDGRAAGECSIPPAFQLLRQQHQILAEIVESYADDFHAASSHVSPDDIAADLEAAAAELMDQAEEHGLSLSAAKSTATHFTAWNSEFGCLPPVSQR